MRIILIGFGVVGRSFAQVVLEKRASLMERYGLNPRIIAIADSRGVAVDERGLDLQKALQVKREHGTIGAYPGKVVELPGCDLVRELEAEAVVEVTRTNVKDGEPGMSHIKEALKSSKHVVTTNKGPLALAMPALLELAEYNGVLLRFSGTVGGGTPILDFAESLAGDEVLSIRGILNGTTNYILTRMEEGLSFKEALREAQRLGYAEADPSMDVDGIDSACKLVIMANWIMKRRVILNDVQIQGIRRITREQVQNALSRGVHVKLLGIIDRERLEVRTAEVAHDDPLCVGGVLNAVTFRLKYAGEETIVGKGAGGMPTASAILRDLIAIKQATAAR